MELGPKCVYRLLAFVLVLALHAGAVAQGVPCELPKTRFSGQRNIFTEEQENWLGEVITASVEKNFQVVHDPELNGYLQALGDRLLANLPPTKLHYRFQLIDLPDVNAFSLPGGYVYVSRKLVAFIRNEDELASVLGHEIGHILTHQTAIDMTRIFAQVAGVKAVTTKADIEDKYNKVLDLRFKHEVSINKEETEQQVADLIGLYAVALSGYDTKAFPSFWDRFARTEGKTGGFWSDLFGTTKPESKRLREMLRDEEKIPSACRSAHRVEGKEFAAWQAKVVAYNGHSRAESLRALLLQQELEPPLRDEARYIRFSPDGRYLMAQDDASIYVLGRNPLRFLFQIDSPDAFQARFSADSKRLTFSTPDLRVETWNLEQRSQLNAAEVAVRDGCLASDVSPEGNYLACISLGENPSFFNGANLDFALYEVNSSSIVYQRKAFSSVPFPDSVGLWLLLEEEESTQDLFSVAFSPSGKYVVAAYGGHSLAVDVEHRAPIPVAGALKTLLGSSFAFLSEHRLIGVNDKDPDNSGVVEFPSGTLLAKVSMGRQSVAAATKGAYAMLRPIKDYAVGVLDLKKNKLFMGYKRTAFDIYDDVFASDTPASEVQLTGFTGPALEPRGILALPKQRLGTLRAFALSPDDRYLAVAGRTQAAVWDLVEHKRLLHLRGIQGGYFSKGAFYAFFPKFLKTKAQIARFDLKNGKAGSVASFDDKDRVSQFGGVYVLRHAKRKGDFSDNVLWEFHDVRTGEKLWQKTFTQPVPALEYVGRETTVLRWVNLPHSFFGAKFDSHLPPYHEKLEFLDTRTGESKGTIQLDTGHGSFRITGAFLRGKTVVLTDNDNRTLLYSLDTGKEKAHYFGNHPLLDDQQQMLIMRNEQDELELVDLRSGAEVGHLVFGARIAASALEEAGNKLFVLTNDQKAFWFDASSFKQKANRASTTVEGK